MGIPKISVPKQKTKASRGLLPKNVKFANAMKNLAFATSLTAELSFGKNANPARIARNIQDIIVEPARKKMIPGFDQVKKNALSAGAKACTISGAGPSVIAFVALPTVIAQTKTQKKQAVKKVGEAMKKGFKSAKVDCEIIICKPSDGPKIIKRK